MKYTLILFFTLLCLFSYSQDKQTVNYDDLVNKDGLMYYNEDAKPYSGKCVTSHNGGGIGMGGFYKAGKKHGDWVWWYKNGEKQRYSVYVNGRKNGKCIYWYKNGIKKCEITFYDNQNIRQTSWDNKGNPMKNPSFSSYK